AAALLDANINPSTGLATDYLNHFNEAIMLLEMVGNCPDCMADIRRWQPMSYREHFLQSHLNSRDLAIAAYASADPAARACFDNLASTMTTLIETTRKAMSADLPALAIGDLAGRAADWLKPLVARAGAVINGEIDLRQADAPQATADRLMRRA
ncbi:MAG TPA: hypothetical protein VGC36_09550, partial [Rhizomicrobium sp.]